MTLSAISLYSFNKHSTVLRLRVKHLCTLHWCFVTLSFVLLNDIIKLVLAETFSYLHLLEVLILQEIWPVVDVGGCLVHFVLGSEVWGALGCLVS